MSIHNLKMCTICCIIIFVIKRRVNFILRKKARSKMTQMLKKINVMLLAFSLMIGVVIVKQKPIYRVSISDIELGYVQNKAILEKTIKETILEEKEKNIDSIHVQCDPKYELTFVNYTMGTQEKEIANMVKQDAIVTYKFYEIAFNNETIDQVNTIEEAEVLVNEVKEEQEELDLIIIEKYTNKEEEVTTSELEVAKNEIQTKIEIKLEEQKKQKEEEERINSMPQIKNIRLAYLPITGTITSRYAERSKIRRYHHTGLDIAANTGTPIKAIASGTIIHASYQGDYGNLVKIDHGNGVETWYAHTSKMYVSVGQKIEAGEVIAAVGSTGNSTGPHLHLEIRIDGHHVNPQDYLY